MTDEELLKDIQKLYIKITEIMSLMKSGEFIVAYEKIGGVSKILSSLGATLQKKIATKE